MMSNAQCLNTVIHNQYILSYMVTEGNNSGKKINALAVHTPSPPRHPDIQNIPLPN